MTCSVPDTVAGITASMNDYMAKELQTHRIIIVKNRGGGNSATIITLKS